MHEIFAIQSNIHVFLMLLANTFICSTCSFKWCMVFVWNIVYVVTTFLFPPKDALATFVRQSRVQLAELTEQMQVRPGSHSFWRRTKFNKKGQMNARGSNTVGTTGTVPTRLQQRSLKSKGSLFRSIQTFLDRNSKLPLQTPMFVPWNRCKCQFSLQGNHHLILNKIIYRSGRSCY